MDHVTVAGVDVPALGFGTARMDSYDERRRAIDAALAAGYRHLDTAQAYGSEDAVGDAIAEAAVDREDVFVTTKLAGDNRAREDVLASTRESLEDLRSEYVDLLLIHWPNDDVPHAETLAAMDELVDDGLVRAIGISNFSVEQTREAVAAADAPILTNQVEYHVGNRQDDLLSFCLAEEVMLTAYSPLGVGDLLDDETLGAVAERHDATPAQVAIRWLLDQPMVSTIPMSSSPDHVRENWAARELELTDEDRRELYAVGGDLADDLAAALGL